MNFITIPKNSEEYYLGIRDSDNKSGTYYSLYSSKIFKDLGSLDSISFEDNRSGVPISLITNEKIILINYEDGVYGISFEKDLKPVYFGLVNLKDSEYYIVIDDHQNCWISQTSIFTDSTNHFKLLPKEYTVHYYEYDNKNLGDQKNPSYFMSLYDEHYHTVMFDKSAIYPYLNLKTKKELSVINNKNGGIINSKEPFFNSPNNYYIIQIGDQNDPVFLKFEVMKYNYKSSANYSIPFVKKVITLNNYTVEEEGQFCLHWVIYSGKSKSTHLFTLLSEYCTKLINKIVYSNKRTYPSIF